MQSQEKLKLDNILNDLVAECSIAFSTKLSDVRLFGSYARGDYNEDSDIDVMIILDMSDIEAKKSLNDICRIVAMLELKHSTTISPVIYGKNEYDTRKSFGFCKNVETEGVSQYVRHSYA